MFRTSENINSATECHIPEDCNLKAGSIRYLPVGQCRHARSNALCIEGSGPVHFQCSFQYTSIKVVDRKGQIHFWFGHSENYKSNDGEYSEWHSFP